MGKEIVINAQKDQMRIAIVEDGELAEMYFEDPNNERTLGDIHLGRVRRIMPSIKAAFIDVGQASDAFLHFSDIADNVGDMLKLVDMQTPDVSKVELSDNTRAAKRHRPRAPMGAPVSLTNEEDDAEEEAVLENRKPSRPSREHSRSSDFRPESILKRDQRILVKIVKEPISAKGSRVSTDISLAGRFLVLVPLADYVAVSKKIVSYKERRRLRALATSLLPKGFGLIVRTVAEGKNAKTLDTDLRLLIDKWRKIEKRMNEVKDPPALMHQDVNMVSSVIRDLFSDDYDRILCDDPKVFRNIKGYIQAVAPQMAPAVQMHTDRIPVFKAAKIDRAVSLAFESRVPLPTGGYLIIEHTEAMHVVDVNSGRAGKGLSQEANSLKVNLESARMIAQQLRIRDLGGIIVVDFIDLRDEKNRRKVHDELRREFTKDRAVTKVLPMSDFGVVQITRQRLRPSITTKKSTADAMKGLTSPDDDISTTDIDIDSDVKSRRGRKDRPVVTPSEMMEKIDKWLSRHKENGNSGPLVLRVHPFARAFLQRGILNAGRRWFAKYFIRIRIEEDDSLDPMIFRIFDAKSGDELTRRKRSGRRRGKGKVDGATNTGGETTTDRQSGKESGKSTDKTKSRRQRSDSADDKQSNDRGDRRKSDDKRPDRTKRTDRRSNADDSGDMRSDDANEERSTRGRRDKSKSGERQSSSGNRDSRGRGRKRDTESNDSNENTDRSDRRKGGRANDNASRRSQTDVQSADQSDQNTGGSDENGDQKASSRRSDRGDGRRSGGSNRSSSDNRKPREAETNESSSDVKSSAGDRRASSDSESETTRKNDGPIAKSASASRDSASRDSASRDSASRDSGSQDSASQDRASRDDSDRGRTASEKPAQSNRSKASSGDSTSRPPRNVQSDGSSHDRSESVTSPARPETVLFVSRHEPEPAVSRTVSEIGSEVSKSTVQKSESRTSEERVSQLPKQPPKLYTSQHAPRKTTAGSTDATAVAEPSAPAGVHSGEESSESTDH